MSGRVIWAPSVLSGMTSDGYRVEITGQARKISLKICPPDKGASAFWRFSSVEAAVSAAETEIDHHRRRRAWT